MPDCAVASDGPVASVAIFTTRADRTRDVAGARHQLAHVGRADAGADGEVFRHRPARSSTNGPIWSTMVRAADAALLIGDPALFADHERLGLAEDRSGTGMEGLHRPAVCLRVLGGAGRRPDAWRMSRHCSTRGRRAPRRPRRSPRSTSGRSRGSRDRGGYLRENIQFRWGSAQQGLEFFFRLRGRRRPAAAGTGRGVDSTRRLHLAAKVAAVVAQACRPPDGRPQRGCSDDAVRRIDTRMSAA